MDAYNDTEKKRNFTSTSDSSCNKFVQQHFHCYIMSIAEILKLNLKNISSQAPPFSYTFVLTSTTQHEMC
jgi:hypothetical protein